MDKKKSFNLLGSWNAVKQDINKLTKLALRYKTNKTPQSGKSYTDFYYNMFADNAGGVKKVLQIGLGNQEKNSLYMWKDFFPKAKVYGISDEKKYVFSGNRIKTFLSGRTDATGLKNIIDKIGSDIDLVVDEGTRTTKEILASFQAVMPLLKKDITYIIENTDRYQAAEIADNLKNYNVNILRHHRMISRYDRLITVTNKTA